VINEDPEDHGVVRFPVSGICRQQNLLLDAEVQPLLQVPDSEQRRDRVRGRQWRPTIARPQAPDPGRGKSLLALLSRYPGELDQTARNARVARLKACELGVGRQDIEQSARDPSMQRADDRLVLADRVHVGAVT
jgi:hypothetical protein